MSWARSRDNIEWGWGKVLQKWDRDEEAFRVQVLFGENRIVLWDSRENQVEFMEDPPAEEEAMAEFFQKIHQGEYAHQLEAQAELSLHLEKILHTFQYANSLSGKQAFLEDKKKGESKTDDKNLSFENLVEKRREDLSAFIRTSLRMGASPQALKTLLKDASGEVKEIVVASLLDYPTPELEELLSDLVCTSRTGLFEALLRNFSHWGKLEKLAPYIDGISQCSVFPPDLRQRALLALGQIRRSEKMLGLIHHPPKNIDEESFSLLFLLSSQEARQWFKEISPEFQVDWKGLWAKNWKKIARNQEPSLQKKALQNWLIRRLFQLWLSAQWDGGEMASFVQQLSADQIGEVVAPLLWKERKQIIRFLLQHSDQKALDSGLFLLTLETEDHIAPFQAELNKLKKHPIDSVGLKARALLALREKNFSAFCQPYLEDKNFRNFAGQIFFGALGQTWLTSYVLPHPLLKDLVLCLVRRGDIHRALREIDNQKDLAISPLDQLEFYTFFDQLFKADLPKGMKNLLSPALQECCVSLFELFDGLFLKGAEEMEEIFFQRVSSASAKKISHLMERFSSFQSKKIRGFLLEKGARTLSISRLEKIIFFHWERDPHFLDLLIARVFRTVPPHNLSWEKLCSANLFFPLFGKLTRALWETEEKKKQLQQELSQWEGNLKNIIHQRILPLLKTAEGQAQGIEFLQGQYKKLLGIFKASLISPAPLAVSSAKSSEKSTWEDVEKLNKELIQSALVSKGKQDNLREVVARLSEEALESLAHQSMEDLFEKFHPLLLHHLWQRWWELAEPLKRGAYFVRTILPTCRAKDRLWQWGLGFLASQMAIYPDLVSLWEDHGPDFLPELFSRVHQRLWSAEEEIHKIPTERKKMENQWKFSLVQDIHLTLKNLEGWISHYEEFRLALEELGVQKVAPALGRAVSNIDPEKYEPQGSGPLYRIRSYGISVDGEGAFPSAVEGEKEQKYS